MKRKIGWMLVAVGVLCLLVSAGLFVRNLASEQQAATASQQALEQIVHEIEQEVVDADETVSDAWLSETVPPTEEMATMVIDGNTYVGYLSLPTLGLELPVLADTDQDLLRIAPCRFTGSVQTHNLVIGAHNYQSHFGRLTELSAQDAVVFTDVDGKRTVYRVVTIEVLSPTAVPELTAGDYPLTLYTCTYGGASRVTVRLDQET